MHVSVPDMCDGYLLLKTEKNLEQRSIIISKKLILLYIYVIFQYLKTKLMLKIV